jgi:hypothetical protein
MLVSKVGIYRTIISQYITTFCAYTKCLRRPWAASAGIAEAIVLALDMGSYHNNPKSESIGTGPYAY